MPRPPGPRQRGWGARCSRSGRVGARRAGRSLGARLPAASASLVLLWCERRSSDLWLESGDTQKQ